MKLIILGLKYKDKYYAYYGKNYKTGNGAIKSRPLVMNKPVNVKYVSIFPYNCFSDLDRDDVEDRYQLVYLYANLSLTKDERNNMGDGDFDNTLLEHKQVKLLGEAINPYHDLLTRSNVFINSHYKEALYGILVYDFPLFCNKNNCEDYKKLIEINRHSKYALKDYDLTSHNFILYGYLVNLNVSFGVDGEVSVSDQAILDYYKDKPITKKELFRVYDLIPALTVVACKQGLIDKLKPEEKARLYDRISPSDSLIVKLIKNKQLDINDLFKARLNYEKQVNKYDYKILLDKNYQPQQIDDYDDDWLNDEQEDEVDDVFQWYKYIDKDLLYKVSKRFAPRVNRMLEID